jgi:hypothetical protein
MNTHGICVVTLGVVAMGLGACAPLTPRLDQGFGDSVRLAVATQIQDRDAASKNARKDPSGLDGAAAKEVLDRYHKSFRVPEPVTSVFTIGVSGGGTSR